MNNILLDTNVLIHLLNGHVGIRELVEDCTWYISFITEMELQLKHDISPEDRGRVLSILEDCRIVEMNHEIKQLAIQLAQRHRLKLADSIILATARHTGMVLITADLEFNKVDDPASEVLIIRP